MQYTVMQYTVMIERGDTSFGAYVPDLPGCVAVGESEAEAQQLIREAVEWHLQDMKAAVPIPIPIPIPISRSEWIEVGA